MAGGQFIRDGPRSQLIFVVVVSGPEGYAMLPSQDGHCGLRVQVLKLLERLLALRTHVRLRRCIDPPPDALPDAGFAHEPG